MGQLCVMRSLCETVRFSMRNSMFLYATLVIILGLFCVALCVNVTIPWPRVLKRKWIFVIKRVPRLHCASPHFLCVFCEWVMRLRWVEGHEYYIIHVCVCVQTFLGLELSQMVGP